MSFRIERALPGLSAIMLASALVLPVLGWPGGPALAQSLLEQIFGLAPPKPVVIVDPRLTRPTIQMPGGSFGAQTHRASTSDTDTDGGGKGTYRTVCVRMCDGYYVPISFATTHKNIYQDQVKCRATCGDDARVFFHRNPGGKIDEAIDLSGRVYGRLPNAFRYRKTLIEGCTCRPPPWSEAELARHRSYAEPSQTAVASAAPASGNVAEAAPGPASTPATIVAKVADAGDVEKGAAAGVTLQPAKTRLRGKPAEQTTAAQVAAKKPQAVIAVAPAAPSGGGIFGFGAGPSMGLGAPKYVWPGDTPPRRN